MADPTKNIKQFAIYGLIVGFILSLVANGLLVVKEYEEDGMNLAGVYVWILPAVGGVLLLIDRFTKHKIGTKAKGFFEGFSIITVIVNVVLFGIISSLVQWLESMNI